jgi:cobalt-zinc-cadmium efflux system outer membrane protein
MPDKPLASERKRMKNILMLSVGSMLLVAGCDSGGDNPAMNDLLAKYQVAASDITPLTADKRTSVTPPSMEQGLLPDGSGPEEYVRIALERNPSIRRAQYKVLRLANRIPQATSLDDPMLNVVPIGEMAETAAGQVGLMTGVSQRLPFPGKLDARGQTAGQEMAAAAQELAETRLSVVADVRRAYWSYYYATMAIDITQHNLTILDQFKDVATAKFQAGTATQQDVLRVTVEISNLNNELLAWRQRRTTAVAMLNSLMDRPVAAPVGSPRAVQLQSVAMQLDQLLAEASQANPTLARIKHLIQADEERLRLAKLQRWPDLTVGFSYNFVDDHGLAALANGKDQWWVGFGLNIPIWFDKLNAAEREARNGIRENAANLADMTNRVDFRVQDALSRVDTQQKQALIFRDVIIPQAQQTLEVSVSDYEAGKVEFLTLVDNWRKLLNFQLMYHQSLSQLEQDFADLQQAIGHDVSRAASASEAPPLRPQTGRSRDGAARRSSTAATR